MAGGDLYVQMILLHERLETLVTRILFGGLPRALDPLGVGEAGAPDEVLSLPPKADDPDPYQLRWGP